MDVNNNAVADIHRLFNNSAATPTTPSTQAASATPALAPARLIIPKPPTSPQPPAQAPRLVQEALPYKKSLQYESASNLSPYVKLNNKGALTNNINEINKIFTVFLTQITTIRVYAATDLNKIEQKKNIEGTETYFNVIKTILKTENKYIDITHSLDVTCNKETISNAIKDLNNNETAKSKLSIALNKAFDIESHPTDMHIIAGATQDMVAYFKLQKPIGNNNKRWKTIPNTNTDNNKHTVTTNNTRDTSVHSEIQEYLNTCDIHQQAYIKSHNNVIKLFNYLKIILKNIKTIIVIIEKLSNIKTVNKNSGLEKVFIKLPQNIINIRDLDTITNSLANNIPPQSGGFNNDNDNFNDARFNMHAGATAVAENISQYNLTKKSDTIYELNIRPDDNNRYTYTQKINITININVYKFMVSEIKDNVIKLSLISDSPIDEKKLEEFNKLSLEYQRASINIIKFGIQDKGVAGVMKSVASFIISATQNLYDTSFSNTIYNDVESGNNEVIQIPLIETNKIHIDNVLLRCYDLQVLYLIKYFENIVLYKYIIYFANILTDCICVAKFIILLFDFTEIDVETIPGALTINKIITDVSQMIKDNDGIITTITDEQNLNAQSSRIGEINVGGGGVTTSAQAPVATPPANDEKLKGAVPVIAPVNEDITTICNDIYYYKKNNTTPDETLHKLYEKLYKQIKNTSNQLNLKKQDTPFDKNKVSKTELYYNYSKLYNAFVIPFIRKHFNTHDSINTSKVQQQKNIILIQKFNAIAKYFADFDCKTNAEVCLNTSLFNPDTDILYDTTVKSATTSINTILLNEPFKFVFTQPNYNDAKKLLLFYRILYDAAHAGVDFDNINSVDYDKMIELVEKYFTQNSQSGGDGMFADINIDKSNNDMKTIILNIINAAKKVQTTQKAADAQAAETLIAVEKEKAAQAAAQAAQQAAQAAQQAAQQAAAEAAVKAAAKAAEEATVKAAAEAAVKAAVKAADEATAQAEAQNLKNPTLIKQKFIDTINADPNMPLIIALNFVETKFKNAFVDTTTKHDDTTQNIQNVNEILKYDEFKIKSSAINFDTFKTLVTQASKIITNFDTFKALNTNDTEEINTSGDEITTLLDSFSTGINNEIVSHLKEKVNSIYELIGGAAQTYLKLKPNIPIGHTPEINISEIPTYKITDYYEYLNNYVQKQQHGGYKYSDIINIDNADKFTIKIAPKCNNLLDKKDGEIYGPFAGIFTQNYNNFDIYGHLFGVKTINEHIRQQHEYKSIVAPPFMKGDDDSFNVKNARNDLTKTLSEGRNVVVFGYGFSGSGKTYTLVEGSKKQEDLNKIAYDPSLLEQFINNNLDSIESIEFLELYPLGDGEKGKIKIICGNDADTADIYIYGDTDDKTVKTVKVGKTEKKILYENTEQNQLYDKIVKTTNHDDFNFDKISKKIVLINKERRKKLRILATPNNDDSSRGYLQITINLKTITDKQAKLVFFDMPGSENTVRITQEFLGVETFSSINELRTKNEKTSYKQIGTTTLYSIYNINTETSKNTNTYIYFVNNHDNKQIKDKNILNTQFKELIINFIKYKSQASRDGIFNLTEDNIASCSEKITLFFNQETCESIFDVIPDKKIFFLKDNNFKTIVDIFLKTVIFQPSTKIKNTSITDHTLYFKYFKLTFSKEYKDNTIKIDPNEYNLRFSQITKIYDITYISSKIPEKKQLYATFSSNLLEQFLPNIQKGYYTFRNYEKEDTNVMILLFMYLFNDACTKNITHDYKNQKTDVSEYLYRILIIYVYKYVKFIIDQGSAIVTTLEHLKYFFLSNINKIDKYNESNSDKPEKAMTLYDKENTTTSILTTERIYTTPTKLTFKNKTTPTPTQPESITLYERVNFGNMSDYKLLSILQKLSNASTKLTDYINLKTFNLQKNTAKQDTKTQSLFIMLAHIKCFSGDSNNELEIEDPQLNNTLQKLCTAQSDTLIFAQSISSTSQSAPPATAAIKPDAAAQGGSITNSNSQHKTKKNIKKFDFNTLYKTQNKDNKHKSFTIKKKNNNVNQSIFKIKSKKQ